jgi:Phospholipase_D-nuclease N-terminal
MDTGINFSQLLLLLIPVLIIQLGLQIYALYDLYKQPKVRGPKWVWVLVIILGEILGPIIYFFLGRKEA